MKINELREQVIEAAIEENRALRLGLPVEFKGSHLDCGYRIDLLIENTIPIEIKPFRNQNLFV
jgi:hypothetical protein